MEEIEYKAWLKDKKILVDVDNINFKTKNIIYTEYDSYTGYPIPEFEKIENVVLLPGTKLYEQIEQDKVGERIFLNDIIITDSEDGICLCKVIESKNPKMIQGYEARLIKTLDIDCSSSNIDDWSGEDLEKYKEHIRNYYFIKVIGNRYETPELWDIDKKN